MPDTELTPRQIAGWLEGQIHEELVDYLTTSWYGARFNGRKFRVAYLEETRGLSEDTLVLIEEATGDLYEVEIDGVTVYKIEPFEDVPLPEPTGTPDA